MVHQMQQTKEEKEEKKCNKYCTNLRRDSNRRNIKHQMKQTKGWD
jgi:hypothetical protein